MDLDSSNMDSSSNSSQIPSSETDSETSHRLNNMMVGLTCSENNHRGSPRLVITEQPQMNFRFRYKSEMGGTHGCLLGQTTKTKQKTHPSVKLVGYEGRARIKCHLVQCDNNRNHPHKFQEDESLPQEVSGLIGPDKFTLVFPDMGIIYTAKKQVPLELYKFYSQALDAEHSLENKKRLMNWCEQEAKTTNLNIVRLKFTAHNVDTDEEICPAVFSNPIHNLKSAETNELKICRIDRKTGSVNGNEEIFILVEKVNKKNIKVRFLEVDELTGVTVWTSEASFTQNDVHHQFAIVFKTPPYRNLETPKDVNVYIELYRPQDGRTSAREPFTYKSNPRFSSSKKRKATPSLSSLSSLEDGSGSLKSGDIPLTVLMDMRPLKGEPLNEVPVVTNITVPQPLDPMGPSTSTQDYMQTLVLPTSGNADLGTALYQYENRGDPPLTPALHAPAPQAPAATYVATFVSSENNLSDMSTTDILDRALNETVQNSGEFRRVLETLESDPFKQYRQLMENRMTEDYENSTAMSGINFQFTASGFRNDAAKQKKLDDTDTINSTKMFSEEQVFHMEPQGPSTVPYVIKKEPYSAKYDPKDGVQVKRDENPDPLASSDIYDRDRSEEKTMTNLVKEFLQIIKNKDRNSSEAVNKKKKEILQNLMELRLSNGDTFLHMLVDDQTSMMEYIVKQMNKLGLQSLMNIKNYEGETLLHLAIKSNLKNHVAVMIECGCDPMLDNVNGDNAVHTAVLRSDRDKPSECLRNLLDGMRRTNRNSYNIDALNNDRDTPLHLAAKYGYSESLRMLVEAGANIRKMNGSGKLALHLASSGDHLNTLRTVLNNIDRSEVDCVDGINNTALQIVCSNSQRDNSLAIAELLCQHGANVLKSSGGNSCPLKLACKDKKMLALLQKYAGEDTVEIKSEPEDEYESAEEDSSDEEYSAPYISEIADILDKSGNWRTLANKLECGSIMNWYENTPSPTRTLFDQMLSSEKLPNPRVFAIILQEMGEKEAAEIVLRYLK